MTSAPAAPAANTTYIIGHRNPDADAICSAIAYAAFKEQRGELGYAPARCGNSNARIDTILQRFNQPLPVYLSDVSPRVRDLMVAEVIAVDENATCAEALELIDRHSISVVPVTTSERRVVGTVSLAHMGGFFIPRLREPRQTRQVHTSLARIARAPSTPTPITSLTNIGWRNSPSASVRWISAPSGKSPPAKILPRPGPSSSWVTGAMCNCAPSNWASASW
jgi:manganese-dependent inorganic pyrophosphatase